MENSKEDQVGNEGKGQTDTTSLPSMKGRRKESSLWKNVCITMYNDDIKRIEILVKELKTRGYRSANRSQLIRAAIRQVDIDKISIPEQKK